MPVDAETGEVLLAGEWTPREAAEYVTDAWQAAVSSIIETGRRLIEAKLRVGHGNWLAAVDLMPFGRSTAEYLMQTAKHPTLSNPSYSGSLPAAWRTLSILAQLPEAELTDLIKCQRVTPELQQFQARALVTGLKNPAPSLADRFGVPPFSVLDRRSGDWMDRKRRWMEMGIASEVGRDAGLAYAGSGGSDPVSMKLREISDGTSVFDPALCELVYRWFSPPGARILDPFCGGSVRGIVASALARQYVGVDVRQEQIDANRNQVHLCTDVTPTWVLGDATRLGDTFNADEQFDMIFSCPPYADLEVYSDDPNDISTWSYDDFLAGHARAIRDACNMLRPDRYAAWVIGDVRDSKGRYRGLHHATVDAFRDAGLQVVNEFVLLDPLGAHPIRAGRPFVANRKATLVHQHLLVFVKGDVKRSAEWAAAGMDGAWDDDIAD